MLQPAGSAPIGDGASLIVATAHFATGQAGQPFLSIENAAFYDATLVELGSCNPTIGVEMNCHGALIDVGSPSPPTGPIPTSTRASTRTPSATRTPVPTATRRAMATRTPAMGDRCADVNGDGHVTATDLREIVRGVRRGPYDATYDINRDGRLGVRDVLATMRQLGGRC